MAKKKHAYMRVDLKSHGEIKKKLGVDEKGRVQNFITDEVLARLLPYIPKRSGTLRSEARKTTSTQIKVYSPYARVQFFGVTKLGVPFNYNLVTGGAKAGSHWDRRLMEDEGAAIVAKANRIARRR